MSQLKTEQTMFDAAIESANVFNGVASECASTSGLLDCLREYSSPDETMRRFQVHPEKAKAFRALLDVLVDTGMLEKRTHGGQLAYRARSQQLTSQRSLDGGIARYRPRLEVLDPWFGDQHVDLIHSSNHALLGHDLSFFHTPSHKLTFTKKYLDSWRTNLQNPLYEFGRVLAVRELVQYGHRFLDLCSGLGFGSERLAQFAPDGCEIVCVDKSQDFLDEARLVIYPGAKVRFVQRDLNHGLPPLPEGSFDGVLFNGSFHFMLDKEERLREIHRVLRPGGLLVIGHCFSYSGFADQAMHELFFSLVDEDYWPLTWDELRGLVSDAGFREFRQYHRGSHSYVLAERLPGETEPAAPQVELL